LRGLPVLELVYLDIAAILLCRKEPMALGKAAGIIPDARNKPSAKSISTRIISIRQATLHGFDIFLQAYDGLIDLQSVGID